jgi:hypothetical protein
MIDAALCFFLEDQLLSDQPCQRKSPKMERTSERLAAGPNMERTSERLAAGPNALFF